MGIDEDDARIKTLNDTLRATSTVYSFAEKAGITAVRLLNTSKKYFNVVPENINGVMREVAFEGPAGIGNKLRDKVLVNHVTPDMKKPLLVIVATDAEVRHPRSKNSDHNLLMRTRWKARRQVHSEM